LRAFFVFKTSLSISGLNPTHLPHGVSVPMPPCFSVSLPEVIMEKKKEDLNVKDLESIKPAFSFSEPEKLA
jgi:hypothetical protein